MYPRSTNLKKKNFIKLIMISFNNCCASSRVMVLNYDVITIPLCILCVVFVDQDVSLNKR